MRKLILIALVLVASCKERPPTTWSGIPDPARAVCSSTQNSSAMQCISQGAAYACVHSRQANHVECARTSPLFTPELGK